MQAAEGFGALHEDNVLFYLEAKNESASAVIQNNPHRAVSLRSVANVRIKTLCIRVNEPNQRRGLVVFRRHPNCRVKFKDPKVAGEHCFIDINPLSGELLLCDTSRDRSTGLDNEMVRNPAKRAMVYHHARHLKVSAAIFEIHWPSIPDDKLTYYCQMKVAAARRLREDPERIFDLTDMGWDLVSVPPTADPTRQATPSADNPFRRGPIAISKLGQGSYGTVYKAVDRITADFVAVKEFNANVLGNDGDHAKAQVMEAFKREIIMMKDLRNVSP